MRLSRIWRILQIKEGGSASVDNTLRDLQNSSYPTKAEFNNCFIIHSKYFPVLNGASTFRSLFFCSPKSQSRPQVFSVNGWIICSGLHFWRHWLNVTKILSKFGEQQLVMVNYACGFNQSETGKSKYFEWIINNNYSMSSRWIWSDKITNEHVIISYPTKANGIIVLVNSQTGFCRRFLQSENF